jgi:hypothetical protein
VSFFLPQQRIVQKKPKPTQPKREMVELMDGIIKIKQQKRGEVGRIIPETLTGFPGIYVWVSQVDPAIAADGLDRERLWFEVQKRLTWAGLPVPNQKSWQQTPLFPCLGVIIHADQAQVTPPFYVFSVELFFVQKINSADTPAASSMRMVWCREAIGDARHKSAGFDWSNLYSTLSSLVDQFLQEYLGLTVPEVTTAVCN